MKYELICYCENDKFAKKAYSLIHNEPESKNLGDITLVNEKEIADFNWMVGGSPCQDFSVAGKGKGAVWTCKNCKDDEGNDYQYNPLEVHYTKRDKCPKCNSTNIEKTRSSLVVEWLRILNEKKPNVAIYENVKNLVGKKHKYFFDLFIQELHEYGYNTYWKVLNAKNYGIPQNRERVYLVIIKKELDNGKFKFPKGFDNGVRLKDLLEKEVDEKYYISQEKVDKLLSQIKDNKWLNKNANYTPTKNTASYPIHSQEFVRTGFMENCPTLRQRDYKDPMCVVVGNINPSGNGMNGCVYSEEGLAPTATTNKGESNKILQVGCIEGKNFNQNKVVYNTEGVAPTIKGQGHCGNEPKILEKNQVIQVGNIVDTGNWDNPQRGRIYSPNGCSPALNTVGGGGLEPKILEENELKFVGGIDTTDKWIDNNKELSRNYKEGYRVYDSEGIACCQKSNGGGIGSYTGLYKVDGCSTRTRNYAGQSEQLEVRKDEVSNSITTVQKDSMVLESTNRSCSSATVLIKDVYYRIRKLTPLECFRLMGFSDEDFYILKENGISDTQCYKMAGNSIVVDVLYYIYLELYKAMPYLFEDIKLGSFFSGIGAFEKAIIKLQKTIHNQNINIIFE